MRGGSGTNTVLGKLIWLVRAFVGTTLMLGVVPAMAADINAVADSDQCAISIRGPIEKGDADRFADYLKTFDVSDSESSEGINSDRAVCLHSPGGDYVEGRRIAQQVYSKGLTTRIKAMDECYSACALIFMAGRIHGAESDTVSRYLHVDGTLGFHAPYFDIAKDEKLTGERAAAMLRLSNLLISDFVSFGSSRSDFDIQSMISSSLLAEMLAMGPDEMSVVDTVEKVSRWNIKLEGIRAKERISRAGAVRACLNFQSWLADKESSIDSLSYYLTGEEKLVTYKQDGEITTFSKIETGGMEDSHCLVARGAGPVSSIGLCSVDDFNGMRIGDCAKGIVYYVPWYYSLEPKTSLAALK